MKKIIFQLSNTYVSAQRFHLTLLFFRILVAGEMMVVHGLKKIGVGVADAEIVPNPLHLPASFNQLFATASNLVFPLLVLLGLFTRLAILPILAVTLTGYFVVHWHDTLLLKDMPFMYSLSYLLILSLGAGKYSVDYYINQKFRP